MLTEQLAVDASVAIEWCLQYEVANAINAARRRGRLADEVAREAVTDSASPITADKRLCRYLEGKVS